MRSVEKLLLAVAVERNNKTPENYGKARKNLLFFMASFSPTPFLGVLIGMSIEPLTLTPLELQSIQCKKQY